MDDPGIVILRVLLLFVALAATTSLLAGSLVATAALWKYMKAERTKLTREQLRRNDLTGGAMMAAYLAAVAVSVVLGGWHGVLYVSVGLAFAGAAFGIVWSIAQGIHDVRAAKRRIRERAERSRLRETHP
jgi:hypothetical protein